MDKLATSFNSRDKVAIYTDHRYATPVQKGISRREHELLEALLDEMPPMERILDMPVGYGRFTPSLLPRTNQLICLDLSPHMLTQARDRGRRFKGNMQFIGACSTSLPLPDKCIDLTVTIRLFHHVLSRTHRVAILAEMNRVTRQRIILTYYRRGTVHQAQRMVKDVRPRGKRVAFHSEEQFMREIGEAGLELDRLIKLRRAVHSQTFAVLRPRSPRN